MQWQRVTDVAIVYNIPSDVYEPNAVYTALASAVPDMKIYPGVVSNGNDCDLDNANHWAGVAAQVNAIAAATGSDMVFIDNEAIFRKYLDIPPDPNDPNDPSLYRCNPNDPQRVRSQRIRGRHVGVPSEPGSEYHDSLVSGSRYHLHTERSEHQLAVGVE
jgi:hypothetical protein